MKYIGIFKVLLIQVTFLAHLTFAKNLSIGFPMVILMVFCTTQIPILFFYKQLREITTQNTPYIYAKTNDVFLYVITTIVISIFLEISTNMDISKIILYYDIIVKIINLAVSIILCFFASITLVNVFVLIDSPKKKNT